MCLRRLKCLYIPTKCDPKKKIQQFFYGVNLHVPSFTVASNNAYAVSLRSMSKLTNYWRVHSLTNINYNIMQQHCHIQCKSNMDISLSPCQPKHLCTRQYMDYSILQSIPSAMQQKHILRNTFSNMDYLGMN